MIKNGSTIESQRRRLLEELNEQKTLRDRNRWGQFATPPTLAQQIVDAALQLLPKRGPIRYLEPGFGTGPFYSALRSTTSRIAVAKGIELDPLFAAAARNLWKGTGLRLIESDFTRLPPPASDKTKFNLIISNPPYVRHHHINATVKKRLQQQVSDHANVQISGLAGLYSHFMLLSRQWMTSNGIGIWLIPGEFMDVNYGVAVKKFLLDRVTLLRVHRFEPSEVQFDDALVSSVVVFFRNATPEDRHQVCFSRGGSLQQPTSQRLVPAESLARERKWTQAFHKRESSTKNRQTLSDLFTINRGIATGCNKFFVLTEQRAMQLDLPKQFLKPILPSPRYLNTNQIDARPDGTPDIADRRFLLACSQPLAQIKKISPSVFDYLESGQRDGIDQGYLCRHRTPWYLQEDRASAPLLCTYMGRASGNKGRSPFRFILNHSEAIAANVYLLLYPRPEWEERFQQDSEFQTKIFHCLQAIRAESLIGEGRVYGGGLHKVEPKELARVRLEIPS